MTVDARKAFGSYLRKERELRQVPLAEVASVTKVPLHLLTALEAGEWETLPGEVFLRGFVRSYAKHLGIAEEGQRRFAEAASRVKEVEEELQTEPAGEGATAFGKQQRLGLAMLVIILLIIVTLTFSLLWRRSGEGWSAQAVIFGGAKRSRVASLAGRTAPQGKKGAKRFLGAVAKS